MVATGLDCRLVEGAIPTPVGTPGRRRPLGLHLGVALATAQSRVRLEVGVGGWAWMEGSHADGGVQ